jgi:hypothetical protein
MIKRLIFTSIIGASLSACASQPENIGATNVSQLQYENYTCDMLAQEAANVERQASSLYLVLNDKADRDAAQLGIGLVAFWPVLFFLEGGDGSEAQEFARLKGELDAIEKSAVQQDCRIIIPKIKIPEKTAQNLDSFPLGPGYLPNQDTSTRPGG